MSELDTSGLKAIKTRRPKTTKDAWTPLDLNTLHTGTYLACDPSLNGCGVVLFEVTFSGPVVHLAEQFSVSGSAENYEQTLLAAEQIELRLCDWLLAWVFNTDWGKVYAVHESPITGGGRFVRPEAALLGGYAFRRACGIRMPRLPMVRRQDHCRLICGNANAKKPEHHAHLKQLFPRIRGTDLITNEAKRDALSVAIFAAHRGR